MCSKYGPESPGATLGTKLILGVDTDEYPEWNDLREQLARGLRHGLALEIWDTPRLRSLIGKHFSTELGAINADNLLGVRQAIERAKGFFAFGGTSLERYENDTLNAQLLWHMGFWRLRQLREPGDLSAREILPPGTYRNVIVMLVDLCSFSSYVRDTPDAETIRHSLTSFYSKSHYQIVNNGGMFYQFVGDEAIGFYGLPRFDPGDPARALDTARAMLSIGQSVSHHWQSKIDRVQSAGGVHIGMAVGDLEIVSLRPFSRTHIGAIGDCINVAARLMSAAGESEIAVSNSLYWQLPPEAQADFRPLEPLDARNVGRIKAWKCPRPHDPSQGPEKDG